ncbi:MAG: PEP-CTERM sorting domain-containing protein [Phycisphaeraceae bacterium]|nr:PEP-CTERM sorting domain-containing protein [Phycisphaeraceae bacterium]
MKTTALALLSAAALIGAAQTQAANLITSGNINTPGNWDTGVLPGSGETGNVNIDASWPVTSGSGDLAIEGDLVFGGGSTLTAAIDIVGVNPSSVTFNDVTVNVGDDIFTGGGGVGNFIFNPGSVTNVDDDFEANGGGTITINGGTHTVGINPGGGAPQGNFGAQNNSTLNFLGGTVTGVDLFRSTASGDIFVGGDATLTGDAVSLEGGLDFAAGWTGSLTITGFDGTAQWQSILTGGATLDNVAIDGAGFANEFVVTNNGQTLALVPEPGSLALLGLGGLMTARRRRA